MTAHGVADDRPGPPPVPPIDPAAFYNWLNSGRLRAEGPSMPSVELLDLIYEEPDR